MKKIVLILPLLFLVPSSFSMYRVSMKKMHERHTKQPKNKKKIFVKDKQSFTKQAYTSEKQEKAIPSFKQAPTLFLLVSGSLISNLRQNNENLDVEQR